MPKKERSRQDRDSSTRAGALSSRACGARSCHAAARDVEQGVEDSAPLAPLEKEAARAEKGFFAVGRREEAAKK